MGLARPTGEYAELMLAPDGWPAADEDANYERAQQYMRVLGQAAEVSDHCRREQLSIFDSGVWSGGAASAADGQLGKSIDALTTLLDGLATVITWHRHIAGSILQAKLEITDNVEGAHEQIRAVQNNAKLTAAERTAAINAVVTSARGINSDVVVTAAARILGTRAWKPPSTALQDLLDQKLPPPDESSPVSPAPGDEDPSGTDPAQPGPKVPPVSGPRNPPGGPAVPPPAGPALPPPSVPGVPGGVLPSIPGTPGWTPVTPGAVPSPAGPGQAPKTPVTPHNPAASTPSNDSTEGDAVPAAPVLSDGHSPGGDPQDSSPRVAPASVSGMPAMPMASGAAGGGGGSAPVSGAGSGGGTESGMGASAGRTPPGQAAGLRPASANVRAAAPRNSAARRESTDPPQTVESAAGAVIPISRARAERDAVADAATADAARRKGPDRLQLARRIAAALNAPVSDEEPYFGFFWVTGLTTDGAIVVANSYGLAYIPEGVQLPEQVFMATADEKIPAAERARWTTYPVLAIQGWAAHHNATLRAVIATAEQLANSDPGSAKVLLKADDIPDRGEMIGRSRLAVVDPQAAQRLAQTPDLGLLSMLPAADARPPTDERFMLWLQVMKPMVHDDPRRQEPHLKAFHAYATHIQEAVANEARTAVDPVAQRCAVADWLYWKHLAQILHAARSGPAEVMVGKVAPVGDITS